ncbi:MAG: hypothetical protein BWK76_09480 [Desulfobulbaceae bacterium A2]|nr:MAG: hypothetical protein BWK76_09480 [Desulfobulbaceae bacterium A2]
MPRLLIGITLLCTLWGCVLPASVSEGDKSLAAGDPLQAIQLYQQALQETTDQGSRDTIDSKLEQAKQQYLQGQFAKADQMLAQAQSGRGAAVDQALILLRQSRQYDTKQGLLAARMQELEQERQQLEQEGASTKKQILEAIAGYDFARAQTLAAQALAISPGDKEAVRLQTAAVNLASIYANLSASVDQGNLAQAADAFTRLNAVAPAPLDPQKMPLRDKFVALLKRQLQNLKDTNRWSEAFSFLAMWKLPELEQELAQVRQQGVDYYVREAKNSLAQKNPHRAFLLAEKAMSIDDKRFDIFTLHKESRDQVDKALMRYIAVGTFDSPSTDPDAGRQFSDSLISHLYNMLPYGINILERDKIDVAMKEKQVGNQQLGDMLGVELVVTGTVSLFKVDQVLDKRNASVKLQTNQEVHENPAYQAMLRQYGPDEQTWPNVPPQTITRFQNQMVNYTKGTATLKGFSKVSVRIFDTKKGAISFVKDLEATVSENSEFQDEVAEAGIPYIPMKLPTETETKEVMRKQIINEIGKIVQSSFEAREQRFLNQARFFLERRETEQALTPLAEGLLYCQKDNLPVNNPALLEIRKLIDATLE